MNRSKPASRHSQSVPRRASSSRKTASHRSESSARTAPQAADTSVAADLFSTLSASLDPKNLDRSADPSQDFFRYANGGWIDSHPIPADRSSVGAATEVDDRNRHLLLEEIHALVANPPNPSTTNGKLARFYRSGMDLDAIEKAGTQPLEPVLAQIAQTRSSGDLLRTMAHLTKLGADIPISVGSERDSKDSQSIIAGIFQSGLGLPNSTYYTKTDPDTLSYVAAYQDYAARLLELTGDAPERAKQHVATLMDLERQLAAVSLSPEELRDPEALYNPMSLAELEKLAPGFPWKDFFEAVGIPSTDKINVGQPKFVQAFGELFESVPLDTWKMYLRLRFAESMAPFLNQAFRDAAFDFRSKVTGVTERRPREESVFGAVSLYMGEATGRIFVEKAFPPEAKARMDELVGNLRSAMADHIRALPWMSEETKSRGLEKLAAIKSKIGYPEHWDDYADLTVTDSYAQNAMSAFERQFRKDVERIGKPPDPDEFDMTADEVNAYYSPEANEVVFPAGILQPPYFDMTADDAVNYGGIGATIAHEITHAFDDEGRQFDAKGNLNNWWNPKDEAEYNKRVKGLIEQFDALDVDGVHVNGKLTLGENIADLSGLALAYDAFRKSLEGKPEPKRIDGFTANQRFFLAYATSWRASNRLKSLKAQIKSDPHAPDNFRTNVPLANFLPFRRAFRIHPGTPLAVPAKERVVIW